MTTRPAFSWRRFLGLAPARAAWIEGGEWQHHNLLSEDMSTPEARRALRRNGDYLRLNAAVYAAIRRRVRAVGALSLVLVRRVGKEFVDVEAHPALDALERINGSLTRRQGLGLIEQHKLTEGKAVWIKRRNGLGVPVEFEIWPPGAVSITRDAERPWMPLSFSLHKADGSKVTVLAADVIYFRHLVDPDDPLNGLSPLAAVRASLDTGIEAQRYNQRFFDNSTSVGQIFAAKDAGLPEIQRLEKDIDRKFKGTDNAHRATVFGGDIVRLDTPVSHKDMEFLAQLGYTNDDVARVFEIAGELIGSGSRTYENTEFALRDFWQMIVDQAQYTVDEFNEFFIKPDFGDEYELRVDYSHIQVLQADRKLQAEIDEINLRVAKVTINELRDRDGSEAVAWGDVPIVNRATMGPLDYRSAEEREAAKAALAIEMAGAEPVRSRAFPQQVSDDMQGRWERRLREELRSIIAHLQAADARALSVGDASSYDWDWWQKYGDDVMAELTIAFEAALSDAGFVGTPLASAQQLAADYARARAAEMLELDGRENVVKSTRAAVQTLVAETIESGDSLQTLQKRLRESYAFSPRRAETIARTETAKAVRVGTLKSYESLGHEGKEWQTAGDSEVCEICQAAQDEGAIPLAQPFQNGEMGPPPHPRCRCDLLPVREMGRAALSTPSRNGTH